MRQNPAASCCCTLACPFAPEPRTVALWRAFAVRAGNRRFPAKARHGPTWRLQARPLASCLVDLNGKVVWVAQEEEPLAGELVDAQRFMRNPRSVEFRGGGV